MPPPTRWKTFRALVRVIEVRLRFVTLMAITGLVFGNWDTTWNSDEKWHRPPAERELPNRQVAGPRSIVPSCKPGRMTIDLSPIRRRPHTY